MAVDAAVRLQETGRARRFVGDMLELFPASPLIDKMLLRGAELAAGAADTLDAARFLVRYHDRNPARSTRSARAESAGRTRRRAGWRHMRRPR